MVTYLPPFFPLRTMKVVFVLIAIVVLSSVADAVPEIDIVNQTELHTVSDDDSQDELLTAINESEGISFDKDAFVTAHNNFRCKYGVANVTWDTSAATHAQSWADKLAENNGCGNLSHSQDLNYGENIAYWASSKSVADSNFGQKSVDMWASEEKNFDSGNANPANAKCTTGVCGHFTQLVWNTSTKIGCGVALCSLNTQAVVVCNYSPAGNMNINTTPPYKNKTNTCSSNPTSAPTSTPTPTPKPKKPKSMKKKILISGGCKNFDKAAAITAILKSYTAADAPSDTAISDVACTAIVVAGTMTSLEMIQGPTADASVTYTVSTTTDADALTSADTSVQNSAATSVNLGTGVTVTSISNNLSASQLMTFVFLIVIGCLVAIVAI